MFEQILDPDRTRVAQRAGFPGSADRPAVHARGPSHDGLARFDPRGRHHHPDWRLRVARAAWRARSNPICMAV